MKVSKVGTKEGKGSYHLRTGVTVTGNAREPGQQGILYYVPNRNQQNDTKRILNERIGGVQRIYVVFSSIDTKKYQSEVVKCGLIAVNDAVVSWLKERNANSGISGKDATRVVKGIADGLRKVAYVLKKDEAREVSIEEIRNSLHGKAWTDENKKAVGLMIDKAITGCGGYEEDVIPFLNSMVSSYKSYMEEHGKDDPEKPFKLISLRRDKMYYPVKSDKLVGELNKAISNFLKNYCSEKDRNKGNNKDPQKGLELLRNNLSYAVKEFPVECSDYVVDNFLRKSLSRESIAKDLKNLLREQHDGESRSGEVFFKGLLDDYSGKKLELKSILNRNLPVQPIKLPSGTDGEVILSVSGNHDPSGKKMDYKAIDKESLRKFLLDYATLDDQTRKDMRMRLRRLVVLYFYGLDEARKTVGNDFDEYGDHEKRRANTDFLVDVSNLSDQGFENSVKNLIHARNSGPEGLFATAERGYLSDDGTLFFEDNNMNLYWIRRISSELERVTQGIGPKKEYMLQLGYVSEKVWKGLINYLSVKYVAIGKSVYQFTMDGIAEGHYDGCGDLDPAFAGGISSFELERIKAEETLQREVAVSVAFAARHLQNATVNVSADESDFLLFNRQFQNDETFKDREHLLRDVLQFFGGKSKWEGFDFPASDDEAGEVALLRTLKDCIFALRNETFHFKTKNHARKWNELLVGNMFEHDCGSAASLDRDRFYSNNLPMFFKNADLKRTLAKLYGKTHERASQVPAFNTVFVRSKFKAILNKEGLFPESLPGELREKYLSAAYYLFKEIYYNDFLQNGNDKQRFYGYLNSREIRQETKVIKGNEKLVTVKDDRPLEDFKEMVQTYKSGYSFSELCQAVMTEYNQQNNQVRRKQSARDAYMQPNKFRHYVDLLKDTIMNAFLGFLRESEEYAFIFKPKADGQMPCKEDFIPEYQSARFEGLVREVRNRPDVQKWYVTARLLSPRQVNLLAGSLRSYKQYTQDVAKRSLQENSPLKLYENGKWRSIREGSEDLSKLLFDDFATVLQVVDVCTRLNGSVAMTGENEDVSERSTTIRDYFNDGDAYARYLSNYLDFGQDAEGADARKDGYSHALAAFSSNFSGMLGINPAIYHDGTNPILNRNVVLSKLYGDAEVVRRSVKKVDEDALRQYLESKGKIAGYVERGFCETEEEQRELKKYQALKNYVELRNVVEYDEILNELQGQLVNWAYIRERDLMYFQLGFHYMCLKNDRCEKPEGYQRIHLDGTDINNAVLYQFTALYVNGLPFYYLNDKNEYVCHELKKPDVSNSTKESGELIRKYLKRYCRNGERYLGHDVYLAGMELFENVKEHDNVVNLRNYVDHFHFFIDGDRSMMDVYSEVFDRFFSYDSKYRKNVVNMFRNILLAHFVKAEVRFEDGEKQVGRDGKDGTKALCKKAARLRLATLEADEFKFKLGKPGKENSKECRTYARDEEFLKTVKKMLTLNIRDDEYDENVKIINDRCGAYAKGKNKASEGKKDRKYGDGQAQGYNKAYNHGAQNGARSGGQYGGQNGGQNRGQYGGQNRGQYGGQNRGQNGGWNGGQNGGQNGNRNGGQNGGKESGKWGRK